MADKSDRSRPTIALPQGGGAIQALGETFSPDLFTGTGNFTVPLALPPGRNGLQPSLTLRYSTGHGNGPFGLGWELGTPSIARKTSKGVPAYDATDVFILAGAEDLVRLPVAPGIAGRERYRPRTEGAFASIERAIDATNDFWTVTGTSGLVSVYGTPSRRGADRAVVARTGLDRRQAFSWKLTETRDVFGNLLEYAYLRDNASGGAREWDQLYLSRVRYVDDDDPGGGRRFAVTIDFLYEDRPDPFSEYRPGFEIRTRRRCTTIRVSTNVQRPLRVRDYELAYTQDAANSVSLLSSVTVAGYGDPDSNGDQAIERLPPVSFGYTRFEPRARRFVPLAGTLPALSLANPNVELVDLAGTGLPDIVEIDNGIRFWRNRGHGRFDPPRDMRRAPAGLALSRAGVQLMDADGDGRTDLLVSTPEASGFFPITTEGAWDARIFSRHRVAPTFQLDDPDVRLIDLNGDGIIDALRSGTRLDCFFNTPGAGWQDTRQVTRAPLEDFPNVVFSDARVRIADMTGDGLQDIVFLHDRAVDYWPNLGHGRWAARVRMTASPHLPVGFDPKRVLLGDVDGDGAADLVYVDDREVRVWINQSGNGFAATPTIISGTPPVTDVDSLRLTDLLGSGTSGVLWSTDAATLNRRTFWFLDLTGGRKPCLLESMTNNLGAVTRVGYVSSTEERLRDEASPRTRWRTPLPFPVQVVQKVEVVDELSGGKLTTTYRYHQGYWDGVEREFRGFGMVERLDTESFAEFHSSGLASGAASFLPVAEKHFSPPALLKTWFHQGAVARPNGEWNESGDSPDSWAGDPPVFDHKTRVDQFLDGLDAGVAALTRQARRDALRALRGQVLRTELYARDDDAARRDLPYTVAEHAYALVEIEPPSVGEPARRRIFFPHSIESRTTQWERGGDPMTQFTITRYDEAGPAGGRVFDAFGRVRAQTTVAPPRRSRRRGASDETRILATHTTSSYAASSHPAVFIHDRLADSRSYELTTPPGLTESDPDSPTAILRDQADAAGAVAEIFHQLAAGTVRLFAHTMHHYDGDPFDGLPIGELDTLGVLSRSETLVLTETELAAYAARRPDYFGGTLSRPAGAPADAAADLGYHALTIPGGGFGYDMNHVSRRVNARGLAVGWRDPFGAETTAVYDPRTWLPATLVGPLGNRTTADYDYRVCQVALMTDPNGNRTRVTFSAFGLPLEIWTLGQAARVEGSRTRATMRFEYDYFAFMNSPPARRQPAMTRTIRYVRDDTDATATAAEVEETLESREYADGFGRSLQLRARAEDVIYGTPPFGGGDGVLPVSAEPSATAPVAGVRNADAAAPNVTISGWQTYDNKGRSVERFEASFATGWAYQPPAQADLGRRVTMAYDALGRLIRTINPDGSEERVVFGVPSALDTPDAIASSPWETYVYDANDLAPLSQHPTLVRPDGTPVSLADRVPVSHAFTPSSALVDALGRRLIECQRNGPDPATDWFITRTRYDIRGNVLAVADPLGREAFAYGYDLLNRRLRARQLDGGVRTSILDAAGGVGEYRDDKGSVVINRYDAGRRLVGLWAQDHGAQTISERQRIEYVDVAAPRGFTLAGARDDNRLGRIWRHHDEAGLVEFGRRDLRGNLLERTRRVVSDPAVAAGWVAAWNAAGADLALDASSYTTTTIYDALNRQIGATSTAAGAGVPGSTVAYGYNRAGALQSVAVNGAAVVRALAYNAKGQRLLVHYGNGLLTRHAYDERSFRLCRLRTEHALAAGDTLTPDAAPLQDTFFTYDLVGNVVRAIDRVSGSGVRNNPDSARWTTTDPGLAADVASGDALVRDFACDPLYRLTSATGRESQAIAEPRPWADYRADGYMAAGAAAPSPANAPDVTSPYVERYGYDPAGNLLSLAHTRNGSPTWVRRFGMGGLSPADWDVAWRARLNAPAPWANPPGNRPTHVGDGPAALPPTHQFDLNGNLTREQVDRLFVWNRADQLAQFLTQATPAATPSIDARYLYGADGARVKKWVRRNGVAASDESRVYIDGLFEHARWQEGGIARANVLVHVMDTQARVAILRSGPAHPDDAGPAVQYHLGDHLGSRHLVVGGATTADAAFVNREEFLPYGDTSFGSFGRKRFRFTGRERDDESGLQYHRARYYAPWIGRWITADPSGPVDGLNLYRYCRDNPILLRDPGGRDSDVNGTPAESSGPAAETSGTTFKADPVAGMNAVATSAVRAPAPAPAPPAAPAPVAPPRPSAPAPAPAPPTPIATEAPSALKARILAKEVSAFDGNTENSLDEKKYLDTWKHPAMNDVTHGLPDDKAQEFRSKIDPAVMSVLNAPISPSTRPIYTWQSQLGIGLELSCIKPIVGRECELATFGAMEGSHETQPNSFASERFKAGHFDTMNVNDAFGHCFDGCRVAQQCGVMTALAWGREREAWREAGYRGPHDSFPQDVHNEARGVLIYMSQPDGGVDCKQACTDVADTLLDLTAPAIRSH